jgi:chromosome segregation ATPase
MENSMKILAMQLEKKDDDLRNMNSAFNQERMDSRTDYSALQSRITLLEQERLETTSQLAAKREECLSTGRELARHSEDIMNLQSKLTERETEMGPGQQAIKDLEVKSKLLEIAECRENAEHPCSTFCTVKIFTKC